VVAQSTEESSGIEASYSINRRTDKPYADNTVFKNRKRLRPVSAAKDCDISIRVIASADDKTLSLGFWKLYWGILAQSSYTNQWDLDVCMRPQHTKECCRVWVACCISGAVKVQW
jgi:hypothetical protein